MRASFGPDVRCFKPVGGGGGGLRTPMKTGKSDKPELVSLATKPDTSVAHQGASMATTGIAQATTGLFPRATLIQLYRMGTPPSQDTDAMRFWEFHLFRDFL